MGKYNIFAVENRKLLITFLGICVIIFMVVYTLLNTKEKQIPQLKNNEDTSPVLVFETPEKDIKIFEKNDGERYIENFNPLLDEKEVYEKVGLSAGEQNIKILSPGVSTDRDFENMEDEEEIWDPERWGLEEEHTDAY